MTEERNWVDEHRLMVFIETAGALADEAMNALNTERHSMVIEHLKAKTGFLSMSLTFDPMHLRVVCQNEDGKLLANIGTLNVGGTRPHFVDR